MSPYVRARPLLFAIDPERAHDLTLASMDALAAGGALRVAAGPRVDDPVELLGLRFANRIGLAAGLDKNAAHVDALAQMGCGFSSPVRNAPSTPIVPNLRPTLAVNDHNL